MCTAATYKTKDFYFGRTLDYEFSYGEEIVVMPRRFPLDFRFALRKRPTSTTQSSAWRTWRTTTRCFTMRSTKRGWRMAGLNFVGNAVYREPIAETETDAAHNRAAEGAGTTKIQGEGKPRRVKNVAQFEFISYLLSRCASVAEVRAELADLNLTGTPYSEHFPPAQLHWIIADKDEAITVESVADGA